MPEPEVPEKTCIQCGTKVGLLVLVCPNCSQALPDGKPSESNPETTLERLSGAVQEASKARKSPLPDAGDMLFIFLASLTLFMLPNYLFGDGSTGWHIVTGMHILDTGSIPHRDILTASHADKPWVAYQWLTDVIMALLVKAGGLNLLAVACSLTVGFLFLALYDRIRRDGVSVFPSLILVVTGSLLSAMHFLARPHLLNFWGVYLFTTKLEDFHAGRIDFKKMLLWLLPTMLLWTNMHPAFALGIGIAGIYFLVSLGGCIFAASAEDAAKNYHRLKPLLILLACLCLITLVNPYGIELHQYIYAYLKTKSSVVSQTDEFQSPAFHGDLHSICLEMLFAAIMIGLYRAARKISVPRLLTVMVFAHMALQAKRNMPLFAIVALPAIGQLLGHASIFSNKQPATPNPLQKVCLRVRKLFIDFEEQELLCKMHIVPIAFSSFLVVAALTGGSVMGFSVLKSGFDPKNKPTQTLDYVVKNNLDPAHGFNYDNWGGYLRYKLNKRVFMDDRADFFPEPFYLEYASVSRALPGYEKVFEKYHLYWVIMPGNSLLGGELAKNPDWKMVAEDKASKVFVNEKLKTP